MIRRTPPSIFLSRHSLPSCQFFFRKFNDLNERMSTVTDGKDLASLGKEISRMSRVVGLIEERDAVVDGIDENVKLLEEEEKAGEKKEEEMVEIITQELDLAKTRLEEVEKELLSALVPRDEVEDRPVILEVRAGTGGDEASMFAQEMFTM